MYRWRGSGTQPAKDPARLALRLSHRLTAWRCALMESGRDNFSKHSGSGAANQLLDLRVERLRFTDVCSILRRGNNRPIMQTTLNNPAMHSEATTVASALPCPGSFDVKRRLGYVLALTGRSAR